MVAKVARILVYIVAGIVLLNIVLFLLFSIPAVQTRAADFALKKIQPIIDTRVSLDGVRIRLFNRVELNGLYVEDQQQDTLLYTGSITTRILPFDLLRNRVSVVSLSMEDFVANVHRASPDDPFNFQFIIDSFAGEKDTTIVQKDKKPWRIAAEDIRLENGQLSYHIHSVPLTPGSFNASHVDATGFNFRGSVDFLSMENMEAEVKQLTLLENNGAIHLHGLTAHFRLEGTRMESDRVDLEVNQTEVAVRDAFYDRATKEVGATVQSDRVDPADIALFSSRFDHLDKPISFDLNAEGTLPQATLNHINFQYGADTRFEIDGSIGDYSDLEASDLNVHIRSLSVSQLDLESLIRVGAPAYSSPPQLMALGDMTMRLTAAGKLPNFNYNITVDTEQGDVALNGRGRITDQFKLLRFEGPVRANDIIVASIIGENAGVGNSTMSATAGVTIEQGGGVTVTADGNIELTSYKEYPYYDLYFNGTYAGTRVDATVTTDTELNKLDLVAGVGFGEELRFEVEGDIERLDLRPFVMMEGWQAPSLSTRIDAQFAGSTVDDLVGTLVIDQTALTDSSFYYNPGPIYMQALADEGEGKKIEIMSSLLEGEITGEYYFTTMGKELMQALRPHLPSLVDPNEGLLTESHGGADAESWYAHVTNVGVPPTWDDLLGESSLNNHGPDPGAGADTGAGTDAEEVDLPDAVSDAASDPGRNDFQFNLLVKNTEDISYAFSLPFYNVEHATITGHMKTDSDQPLRVQAHVPRLMFGNNDVRETKLDLSSEESGIDLDLNSYLVQSNGHVNVRLHSEAANDSVINRLNFELQQTNTRSNGELLIGMGLLRDYDQELGIDIRIHPTSAQFNDKRADFNDATIVYRKDRITIRNFGIRESEMLLLGIEGVASKSEADNIRLYFNNTEIANILAAFNVSNFYGSLNGEIFVRQALETPMIRTEDLRIENITVYNDTIGTLRIEGSWDQLYSGLNLNAYLMNGGERNLEIKGYVPTGEGSPLPMDVNFTVDNFGLNAIQPLTTSIFSDLSGHLNSNVHIGGSLSEPIAEGWIGINEGLLKVAYTNVTYHLSDTIQIGRDNVGLDNLVIRDQNNRTATLNVTLSHTNFGRMAYNASIKLDDFMLLNNENRTDLMAYGSLRLSGDLNVTGSPAGIYGDGNITTESLSEVTVVLPQTARATEYSGIIYINTPTDDSLSFLRRMEDPANQASRRVSSGIPIVMRATVDLNPLLTAGVVLDPTTGNALEINGEGELSINFNSKSTPPVRLYGDYVIDEGKFHYNLQNLRAIDFTIREGSRLTMAGDPLNTQFNITAYLPVRADLTALSPTFATELANTRVPVNALLQIRGDLQGMDLQYDIELPESSSDIQHRVNSFINTEETKILQFAYLATTGSFIPSEGSPDLNFGSSVFTKFAANTLSRGLDALFTSALRDNWSISTNLESVDGTFDNVRMGVDVSTRLLNNRLRISTNLSYGDNSMMATQQAFMGEFDMEYDINNWLMFRAFNRANERFYRRAPTTQGIGFMVTKEGQSVRDLFDFRFVRPREDE